jgi:Xaa-Pro aminopeptidase
MQGYGQSIKGYHNRCGYGELFGHSLGHGIGLVVHDGPTLSQKSEVVLKAVWL